MEVGKSIEATSQKGGQKMGEMTFPLWIYLPFATAAMSLRKRDWKSGRHQLPSAVVFSTCTPPHPLCSGSRGLSQAELPLLQSPNKHNSVSLCEKSTLIIQLRLS